MSVSAAFAYGIGPVQAAALVDPPAVAGPSRLVVTGAAESTPDSAPERGASDSHGEEPSVGPDPGNGFVRLPGHVLKLLANATIDHDRSSAPANNMRSGHARLTLTLVLKRDDQAGFEQYLADVYNPRSSNFRHFLSQSRITNSFGPTREAYSSVSTYLRAAGFELIKGSKNRMTLTVRAPRATVERALKLKLDDYDLGDRLYFANNWDPALPRDVAAHVFAIGGLATFSASQPVFAKTYLQDSACGQNHGSVAVANQQQPCKNLVSAFIDFDVALGCLVQFLGYAHPAFVAYAAAANALCAAEGVTFGYGNVVSAYNKVKKREARRNAAAVVAATSPIVPDGTGQTVGLVEFDSFNTSDVSDYLALLGVPATQINNLSTVSVNGGVASPGSGEPEVLLDIDTIMTQAPGAKVVVYEAPFNGQASSYTAVFNAMINNGVTIISNSWASCEDQVSQAEAEGIDSVLQAAAASGISVFNGTGDNGSTCLDGSAETISVPADSPHATAVGGTSFQFGPGYTYGSETWWDGSMNTPATGQGGFGVSRYFSQPSYQQGLSGASMRSVPDVAVLADPADGVIICEADAGGCPTGELNGGSSLAAPEWAAFAALINQAQGKNLGSFNASVYPFAATGAFHSAASMGSDFAHVGLGSPNLNVLNRLLSGTAVGPVDASLSIVNALVQPGTVSFLPNGAYSVPADGTSEGGVLVNLVDGNGHTVSGKTVTLKANSANAVISPATGISSVNGGAVAFSITDLTAETLTLTATDTTDGIVFPPITLVFGVPPAASAGISVSPATLPADGMTPATIIVTLKDALNRPSPGKAVTISDAGAHAVITGPTPGLTDANGQIQFSATDQVNETVTFSAIDVTDDNLAIPGTGSVTYSGSTSTACGVGTLPVAATGFTVTPFLTGLPSAANLYYGGSNIGCPGGNNPAFTSSGTVLVSDFLSGAIYQTGLAGGAVSTGNLLGTISPALGKLVYGKDGSVYATVGNEGGEIVQVDPTTGAQLRVVASGLTCPAGLTVDPLSGDLFFDDECTGGGSDDASIFRVIDPANSNANAPTAVVTYATLPATPNGGMAFAPNGTLYAVSGYYITPNAAVEQISGTNSGTPTVTSVAGVTSTFAVAVGAINADGSAQSLLVNSSSGTMAEVPLANPSNPIILLTANAPNVGVTGPDGCLYVADLDTVYKIASSAGGCSFAATSPAPSLSLAPTVVSPNPAQGSAQTFTATLQNVGTLAGVPVSFLVYGVNSQIKLADTASSGSASMAYTASVAGSDTVIATAIVNGTTLTSNTVPVTWTAGKDVTYLSLNTSPQGGTINQAVNVVASLADVSANPATGVSGQTVTLTLGSASCTATTNAAGMATCALTPSQAGDATLTAKFGGNGTLAASTESVNFHVSLAPTPPPTVSIAVSPTSIAAGSSAALSWSSSNATSCVASGSWSGTEATSGTQTVTPANSGSYTYTLTCAGNGGSAAATAVLSATLVAVTVTAKSGGGALTWPLLLLLGVLVSLRMRHAAAGRLFAATTLCLAFVVGGSARADQSDDAAAPVDWTDRLHAGIRVGSMPVRVDSTKIDQGLASLGDGVNVTTDSSGTAGTVFLGYEFRPYAGLELGYTYRDAKVAELRGTIASSADLTPLLRDTTESLRGYGNIVSLAYTGHFELAPRFTIEPRLGGYFWATKVTAVGFDDRIDTTHEGGGVTLGVTAAYRLWRGLELGIAVDQFRGFPNNIATLYGGSLEWRFGR